MFGLEQGNKVLKEIHKELTIERVEKIMDDSAEGIAYQQEISEMLAQNISNADELDVQDELEALEREELSKQIPEMPTAPKTKIHKDKNTESSNSNQEDVELEEEEEVVADKKKQPVLA